jgi:hypoxanthine-guanine phosphoribosyltransferase
VAAIRTLITAEEIDAKLGEIGRAVSADYRGKDLIVVGVLKGAFMVMADLARHIDIPSSSTSWPCPPTAPRRSRPAWSGS